MWERAEKEREREQVESERGRGVCCVCVLCAHVCYLIIMCSFLSTVCSCVFVSLITARRPVGRRRAVLLNGLIGYVMHVLAVCVRLCVDVFVHGGLCVRSMCMRVRGLFTKHCVNGELQKVQTQSIL